MSSAMSRHPPDCVNFCLSSVHERLTCWRNASAVHCLLLRWIKFSYKESVDSRLELLDWLMMSALFLECTTFLSGEIEKVRSKRFATGQIVTQWHYQATWWSIGPSVQSNVTIDQHWPLATLMSRRWTEVVVVLAAVARGHKTDERCPYSKMATITRLLINMTIYRDWI